MDAHKWFKEAKYGMMAEMSSRHTRARYDAEYSFTIRAIDSEVR